MPRTRVVKLGKSLAVRIPKALAERARLEEGDPIFIEVFDGGVQLSPVN
jgi:antitoxin component of MazEF toxin-antitoxin module